MAGAGPRRGVDSAGMSERNGNSFILASFHGRHPGLLERPSKHSGNLHGLAMLFVLPRKHLIEPWPFRRTVMGDGAEGRLADQSRVFGERACPMPRRSLRPCLPPLLEFIVVDQQIHAACTGINPD